MPMTVKARRDLVAQILQQTFNWRNGAPDEMEEIVSAFDRYLDRYIRNALAERDVPSETIT